MGSSWVFTRGLCWHAMLMIAGNEVVAAANISYLIEHAYDSTAHFFAAPTSSFLVWIMDMAIYSYPSELRLWH